MEAWQQSWTLEELSTIDKFIESCSDVSGAHITYVPRQPHPLGAMLKTLCCGHSRFLLDTGVCANSQALGELAHVAKCGETASTTICVT